MFAEARRRVRPDSAAEWMECAGAYAAFNGMASPVTQTFGLGLFEGLTAATLDALERFFFARGAPAVHEVSPFAGVAALDLLCARQYRPIEISSVMYQTVEPPKTEQRANTRGRVARPDEETIWADVLGRGWIHEFPDQREFVLESGAMSAACRGSVLFLAELSSEPGAAGTLHIHEGVALFAGAATVPEMRRRGLQSALIETRMQYAFDTGCELLMIVTEPGGNSQRNAERNGFRVAYTRTKWRKDCPA